MQEYVDQVIAWAAILGPNTYLQAAVTALGFIALGKIAELILSKFLLKIARRSSATFDDELVAMLQKPVFVTFTLIGLAVAARILQLSETPAHITLGVLGTIAIFVWYGFLRRALAIILLALSRDTGSSKLNASMLPLLETVARIVMLALAIYFIFLTWKLDVTPWLASAGIIGLALSFAAKDSLANLFAGISIAADAPYKKGDFIILESGERGMVTHIGLRSTRLLTRDDVEITVPNGLIGNGKIINEAGGPSAKHRIRMAIGVAYGSDIDQVISVLDEIAGNHAEVCKIPAPRVRFRKFGDSSLDLELLCWIDRPVDRGRVLHELHCDIYKRFNLDGIQIPFPQRDLHVRHIPDNNSE